MTATHAPTAPIATGDAPAPARFGTRFAATGLLVGPLLFASTTFASKLIDPAVKADGPEAVAAALADDRMLFQLGSMAGLLATLLFVAWAAGFHRFLEHRVGRDHLAVRIAQFGLTGAIGALVIAFSFKAMFAGGLPGAIDASMYTTTDVSVLHIVHDQLQWVGLLSVSGAMLAVAFLGLRARFMPRSLGVFSLVLGVFVTGMTTVLALPYSAGLAVPVWILVVSIWLLTRARRTA